MYKLILEVLEFRTDIISIAQIIWQLSIIISEDFLRGAGRRAALEYRGFCNSIYKYTSYKCLDFNGSYW